MEVGLAGAAFAQGPVRITLDDAIRLALQHNHNLLAARTTIQQSQAQEIRANSHHVFKVAVNGAILDHPNLAIPFKNRGLDFSHFLS